MWPRKEEIKKKSEKNTFVCNSAVVRIDLPVDALCVFERVCVCVLLSRMITHPLLYRTNHVPDLYRDPTGYNILIIFQKGKKKRDSNIYREILREQVKFMFLSLKGCDGDGLEKWERVATVSSGNVEDSCNVIC